MSITDNNSVVWLLGENPPELPAEIEAMGGLVVFEPGRDAQAELVRAQRLAVGRGVARGLDPDLPRNLSRSIILDA